jgi:hypothetical protein
VWFFSSTCIINTERFVLHLEKIKVIALVTVN